MKTRAEFPRGGTLWCWSFFPKCIDMSGILTCPRDETDLGCIFAQLVPPECGEGRMQEAASWDTPFQCPKFSRVVWGGTGGTGLWGPGVSLGETISLAGAGLGTGCPAVTLGGCCAWVNLPCLLPACWFIQSELGFVCPAWRRVPAWHKFSA